MPVGETITAEREAAPTLDAGGICIGVVVTDIPLDARQLDASPAVSGSGWHVSVRSPTTAAATSSAPSPPPTDSHVHAAGRVSIEIVGDASLNDIFTAVVDATEESVANALFVADTVTGVDGHTAPGLPVDRVLSLLHGNL